MVSTAKQRYLDILENGKIVIDSTFSKKKHYLKKVKNLYFKIIASVCGSNISEIIKRDGLKNLHKHIPVEYIIFINKIVDTQIKDIALSFTSDFCDEILDLKEQYYIYDHMETRIIYPIDICYKSKIKFSHYQKLNFNNYENVTEEIDNVVSSDFKKNNVQNIVEKEHFADFRKYYGDIPYACWRTAPHRDSWYGHPQSSMNLWLGITGCTSENSVFFYPDVFNTDIPYINGRNAPHRDFKYTAPYCPSVPEGNTLIFNPENLHASHIGTADKTRICIITRVNTKAPSFAPYFVNSNYKAEPSIWHKSENIRNRIFNKPFEVDRENYVGDYPIYKKRKDPHLGLKTFNIDNYFKFSGKNVIFDETVLKEHNKILIRFRNKEILIIRDNDQYRAISNRCCHADSELVNGTIEDGILTCPHHLLKININDGSTSCPSIKQEIFCMTIDKGKVIIKK